VMTGAVDVFWMEIFCWAQPSTPGIYKGGAPEPIPQASIKGAPNADNSLNYKVVEAAVWSTRGTWRIPIWTDTRKNMYSAPTRMILAEARANGGVPWLLDGSLTTGGMRQWGMVDSNTTYLPHAKFVNSNRWLFTGEHRDRLADTAIVFCLSCAEWRRMSSLDTANRPDHFVQLSAIGRLFEDSLMAYEILFFGHPELYENNEGTARLLRGRWRTVIVPSVDVLSDAQIKLLSAFVRRGGVIKTLGPLGVTDEELLPRSGNTTSTIAAAAAAGGAVVQIPQRLFDAYANRTAQSSAPLLRALVDSTSKAVPWRVEGAATVQQPPRLWANCWNHTLYATAPGRKHNRASVCHLVNYRLNMSSPHNQSGGVVVPA
jgi:hypothetical protein